MQEEPFRKLNKAVTIATGPWAWIDDSLIERLIGDAKIAPTRRARILLHPDPNNSLHEMLIALPKESCDIPHINFKSGKSFHVIQGETAVMIFTDDGSKVLPMRLAAGKSGFRRYVRLNEPFWHTLIPLSDYVVFIETIIGPFEGNRFAPWAPTDTESERRHAFSKRLREISSQNFLQSTFHPFCY